MSRRRPVRAFVLLAATLTAVALLAGCGSAAVGVRTPVPPSRSVPAETPPSAAQLAAAKQAAGIPACPPSIATAHAVPGGLPAIEVACLGGGRPVNLAGLGRPAVVNVWAQWCGPCRTESPVLAAFATKAAGRLLLLGVDYADTPALGISYAGAARLRFPQLSDPDQRLRGPLKLLGPPVTLFVAADGRIVHRTDGPIGSVTELVDLTSRYLGVSP